MHRDFRDYRHWSQIFLILVTRAYENWQSHDKPLVDRAKETTDAQFSEFLDGLASKKFEESVAKAWDSYQKSTSIRQRPSYDHDFYANDYRGYSHL
jgi:hypothetical protein